MGLSANTDSTSFSPTKAAACQGNIIVKTRPLERLVIQVPPFFLEGGTLKSGRNAFHR